MNHLVEKFVALRSAKRLPLASSILALLTVSACGGGSGAGDGGVSGGDDSGDGSGTNAGSGGSTPQPINYSGAVIKGPLENAVVFLDYDNDGVLGLDEPSVRTASDGSFSCLGM